MAYEPKDNSGALFRNDKKQSSNHPDYKGNIVVEGVDFWISAWLKESKGGVKYMSLSVMPKQKARPAPESESRAKVNDEPPADWDKPGQFDDDQSIPF